MTPFKERKSDRRRFLKIATLSATGSLAGAAAINRISPALLPEELVFDANQSLWARALPPAHRPLDQDTETEVAIIGGGFTGLASAYYLKRSGWKGRVMVLEARRCGHGASGRNGAMLLTMTEDRYMAWSGDPALDKRIYDLTVDNIRRLQALEAEFQSDAEIDPVGALQVCNTVEQAEQARAFAEKARGAGLPVEFWERDQITEAVGTRAYPGALFDPHSGQLHPGKLVRLFQTAAEGEGVEIFENSPILRVAPGDPARLSTVSGKTVKAAHVILATNAFTSKLGFLRSATVPIFEYVACTAPLSDTQLDSIGWRRRIPFNDSRTEVFYLGLTRDNRIHIGGGPTDYVFNNGLSVPPHSGLRFARLGEELRRIFPSLAGVQFETTWNGLVDYSLDGTPSLGQLPHTPNFYYAIGFSGHGVNLTSLFGRILADLVRGRAADWAWLPYLNRLPVYVPNEPWRSIAVDAATWYYRWSDPKAP